MKEVYEVYLCYYKEDIVYVGSGKMGRNRHCVSGISHCYGLNKLHFTEPEHVSVDVIALFQDKKESLDYEKSLIMLHKPIFNTVFNKDVRNDLAKRSKGLRNRFINLAIDEGVSDINLEKFKNLLSEFFNFYSFSDVEIGNITIYTGTFYKKVGMIYMAQLTRFLREGNEFYRDKHFCVVFYKVSKILLGYDIINSLCKTQKIK